MNPPSSRRAGLRRGKPFRCCALGFMVTVRAIFRVGALHEAQGRDAAARVPLPTPEPSPSQDPTNTLPSSIIALRLTIPRSPARVTLLGA
jgi:hypothetical protein